MVVGDRKVPRFDKTKGPCRERACTCITDSGSVCGAEPFLHVAWKDTRKGLEAGWACTEHAGALEAFQPLRVHEVGADCGMPGHWWDLETNRCRCSDQLSGSHLLNDGEDDEPIIVAA
jgi:hypothetical protein